MSSETVDESNTYTIGYNDDFDIVSGSERTIDGFEAVLEANE